MVNKMPLAPILIIQYFNQTRAKQITLYVNPLDDNKKRRNTIRPIGKGFPSGLMTL